MDIKTRYADSLYFISIDSC